MSDHILSLMHFKVWSRVTQIFFLFPFLISHYVNVPKNVPQILHYLHHRRLIFQQEDLCFSLHVSLFGWNINHLFLCAPHFTFLNPYPWSHIVNLYWFQNSDGFPFWKKKRKKKKESYFLFHHEYWLEPNFFVGHSLYSRDFLSRSIKSIIWKERKP